MRPEPNIRIEQYRQSHPVLGDSSPGANWGYFELTFNGERLRIVSSGTGSEWEHVSVSTPSKCPSWVAMQHVKELFWDDEETVVQFHPKKSAYVNFHPHVLHLWKLSGHSAQLPPMHLIAPTKEPRGVKVSQ